MLQNNVVGIHSTPHNSNLESIGLSENMKILPLKPTLRKLMAEYGSGDLPMFVMIQTSLSVELLLIIFSLFSLSM